MKENNKEINFDEVTIEEIKADETQISEHGSHHHHGEHHSHHHSGHGHHSHHHRRGHSSKKKNSKFSAFMKKYKSVLINIVSCMVSVALLIVMASTIDFSKKPNEEIGVQDITQSTIKIETPIFSEKIPLVNSAIFYYLNSENESGAVETYKLFDGHKTKLNVGLPVNLTYSVAGIPNGIDVVSAELELSEYSDYKKPTVWISGFAVLIILFSFMFIYLRYYRLSLITYYTCFHACQQIFIEKR